MTYETIKRNYDRKLWSITMVQAAVARGVISKEEYKDITGKAYK